MYGFCDKYIHKKTNNAYGAVDFLPFYDQHSVNSNVNDFNMMIYHMLNDEYYTGRTISDGTNLRKYDEVAAHHFGAILNPATDFTKQYKCEDVWQCWITNISTIDNLLDRLIDGNTIDGSGNTNSSSTGISDAPDDTGNQTTATQNGSGSGSEVNNSINDNSGASPLAQFLINIMNVSDKVRENDRQVRITVNLVDVFLQCTGMKFAGIIVKDCNGNKQNQSVIDRYIKNNNQSNFDTEINAMFGYINDVGSDNRLCNIPGTQNGEPYGGRPVHISADNNDENNKIHKLLFDRIYAFKYFEYTDPQLCSGNNSMLEFANCFYAATAVTNPCAERPCSDFNYQHWSSDERYAFYKQLMGGSTRSAFTSSDDPYTDNRTCSQAIQEFINVQQPKCETACQARFTQVVALIKAKLNERCYKIDECGTNSVTTSQITALANQFITNCVSMCVIHTSDVVCNQVSCNIIQEDATTCNPTPILFQYKDVKLTPCKKLQVEQAKYWNPEFDFPNKCSTWNPVSMFANNSTTINSNIPNNPQCVSGAVPTKFNNTDTNSSTNDTGNKSQIQIITNP